MNFTRILFVSVCGLLAVYLASLLAKTVETGIGSPSSRMTRTVPRTTDEVQQSRRGQDQDRQKRTALHATRCTTEQRANQNNDVGKVPEIYEVPSREPEIAVLQKLLASKGGSFDDLNGFRGVQVLSKDKYQEQIGKPFFVEYICSLLVDRSMPIASKRRLREIMDETNHIDAIIASEEVLATLLSMKNSQGARFPERRREGRVYIRRTHDAVASGVIFDCYEKVVKCNRLGEPVRCRFRFRNESKKAIEIVEVKAPCGCMKAKLINSKSVVEPNSEGEILAELKMDEYQGRLEKSVYVRTSDAKSYIKLRVAVEYPSLVRIDPLKLSMSSEEEKVVRLMALNEDNGICSVTASPRSNNFEVTVKPETGGHRCDLAIRMIKQDSGGRKTSSIRLRIRFVNGETVSSTIWIVRN